MISVLKRNSAFVIILDRIVEVLARLLPAWQTDAHIQVLPGVEKFKPPLPQNSENIKGKYLAYFTNEVNYPSRKVYILDNINVNGMGVVFRQMRIFQPSLPLLSMVKNFQNLYLLKQWLKVDRKFNVREKAYIMVWDQWSCNNYYHWMTESLGKLVVLKQYYPNCILVLRKSMPDYALLSAALLGFNEMVFIEEQNVVNFKQLIYPGLMSIHDVHNPDLLKQVVKQIVGSLNISGEYLKKKIYVSRSRQLKRRVYNEESVVEVVNSHGFEVVYFEELSFLQQIELMLNTDTLLGIHGANLTNAMFLKPGSNLIEMAGAESKHLAYYYLSYAVDVNYYWFGSKILSGESRLTDCDIEVDTKELDNLLKSIN